MRVLVVEDDPDIRRSIAECLRDEGFDVIVAHDGEHALRLAAAGNPDVILLDLSLPRVDGVEFTQRWRERVGEATVPILAMSGRPGGAEIAQQIGAADYRPKPLDLAEIADLLRGLATKRER